MRALLLGIALVALATGRALASPANVADETALRNAITNASVDVINFTADISVTADLPAIQRNMTINGAGCTLSATGEFRGLFVGAWTPGTATQVPVAVTIQDLTVQNAMAKGGSGGSGAAGGAGLGGAIFVANQAAVTLSNVSLTDNAATGGPGTSLFLSLGGGGGMGGNGGNLAGNARGGGGGLGAGAHGANGGGTGSPGIASGATSGGAGASNPGSGGASGGGGGGGAGFGNEGGGGGGSTSGVVGGAGGFGGGGGAGGSSGGGGGGFGGGGGGGQNGAGAAGGFGAGRGNTTGSATGGGGAGMGGAIFVQQGGSLTLAGTLTIDGNSVTGGAGGGSGATSGSAFGSGFFLQGNDATFGGAGSLTFSPGVGQTQTVSDVIADQFGSGGTGQWGLTKSGAGTLVLAGNNTYGGNTSVTAGTLLVTGSNSNTPVNVSSGGTLGGTGVINQGVVLEAGARIAPGLSIGTLTVGSGLFWNAGATAAFELGAPGTSDKIAIFGSFQKSGGTPFTFDFQGTGQAGTYTLVTFTVGTNFNAIDFSYTNLAPGFRGAFSLTANCSSSPSSWSSPRRSARPSGPARFP